MCQLCRIWWALNLFQVGFEVMYVNTQLLLQPWLICVSSSCLRLSWHARFLLVWHGLSLFTSALVSALWLQEASANWCEHKWRFLTSYEQQTKGFVVAHQTVRNRALCYELCITRNAFGLGILRRKLKAQEFRMRRLYLTVVAEGCVLWLIGSFKGHWEMQGPSFTQRKSLHVYANFTSF